MENKYVKLTKKTAQEIVKREFGISGTKLAKLEKSPSPCYHMISGNLLIIVQSRTSWPYDRYEIEIGGSGGVFKQVLFTDTLEHDTRTQASDRNEEVETLVKQWVRSFDNRSRLFRRVEAYYDAR